MRFYDAVVFFLMLIREKRGHFPTKKQMPKTQILGKKNSDEQGRKTTRKQTKKEKQGAKGKNRQNNAVSKGFFRKWCFFWRKRSPFAEKTERFFMESKKTF